MENIKKKNKRYKLCLERLPADENDVSVSEKLELDFENHDDIFKIIELIKAKDLFIKSSDALEFAIGLKLFSEVILKNRELSLFAELKLAINEFMQKLKAL